MTFMKLVRMAAIVGLVFGTQAGMKAGGEARIAPLRSAVVVTEVKGKMEYAYDSTGWKTLQKGKVLQPGATVRAGQRSAAVLKSVEAPTLIKVSSETKLHLTLEAPAEESCPLLLAEEKFRGNRSIAAKTQRSVDSTY